MAGRNDPCPCGSGRKYKACCLDRERQSEPDPAARMREVQGSLEQRLARFVRARIGEKGLDAAGEEFAQGHEDLGSDGAEEGLFGPWLLYDWRPAGAGLTLAEQFVQREGAAMRESERLFIETVTGAPHSFYDVTGRDPGRTLRLRDILRQVEFEVTERSASGMVEEGDILYARVAPFDGFAIMVGTGSIALPPVEKGSILDLRRSLREEFGDITADLLRRIAPQLREFYLIIRHRLLHPEPPRLCNTDGDPMEFQILSWEVESAEAAFGALKRLAEGRTEEDLLLEASRDGEGRLSGVEFDWLRKGNRMHKHWENTVLGRIIIAGRCLKVEVNSRKRAERIRREVERRLGGRATYLKTTSESVEAALRKAKRVRRTPAGRLRQKEQEEFEARPEAQALLEQLVGDHMRAWVEQKIPVLGGRTPLQAVRDPEGREMVEALLNQLERDQRRRAGAMPAVDLNPVRERLGLKTRK